MWMMTLILQISMVEREVKEVVDLIAEDS